MMLKRETEGAYSELKEGFVSFLKFGLCGFLLFFMFSGVLGIFGYAAGWFGEAGAVLREEAGPRALLKKYEWFKDASAQLSKKKADLGMYDARVKELRSIPRKEMDRFDKADLQLAIAEQLGVASSYNQLAAEYNSNMAKINYRFCNVGDLPDGAEVMPRGYPEYVTK